MNHHHLFDATFWINTSNFQDENITKNDEYDRYSYRFKYNTNLDNISLKTRFKVETQFLAGLYTNKLSLIKSAKDDDNKISIDLISFYRTNSGYLINRDW